MKKLLIISSRISPSIGGVEFVVNQIASGLSEKFEIRVLTNVYRTSKPGLSSVGEFLTQSVINHLRALLGIGYIQNGYKVVETYFIFFGISTLRNILTFFLFPFTLIHFLFHLFLFKPDVINLHFADNSTVYAYIAKKVLPRCKLVISMHGSDINRFMVKSKLHRNTVIKTTQASDTVVFVSNTLYEQFKAVTKVSIVEGKVRIINNAVDDIFLRETSNLKKEYLLYVGRLVEKKGVDILINAYIKLTGEISNLPPLYIVGDGSESDRLEDIAKDSSTIKFVGKGTTSSVFEYMNRAIALVSPSREESFGIVNLEAMARGVPVIASRVGGIPEYLIHGENGLLFEIDNIDELASHIKYLLENPQIREKLSENGRSLVMKRFTNSIQIKRYEEVYS
ncbi:glycosyltransferase family 4 protein [Candidatus Dojkabacteria bacterium]|nr:glycosyltransferase family 4 protein [Candidatus Dojkabacteria bacterium]